MTSKKRYFAFGCSYTNYDWLMVPDLIGVNFPEYYNFGCAGACHTYILNQVVQANEIYNFNAETDYITVGTTGFGRFSRVGVDDSDPTDHKWLVNGDIFPEFARHPDNARLWAREFDSYQWSVYRSLSALKTIKLILDLKGVEHKIYSSIYNKHLINLEFVPQNNNTIDMIKQFNSLVETDESVDDFLVDYNSTKGLLGIKDIPWVDGHPLVCNSVDYVKKYFPEYNTYVTNLIAQDQIVAMNSFSTRQEYVLHFEQTFLRKYRTDYNQISKIKHHPYYVKA